LKSKSILSLQTIAEKLKSDCPEDVQLQIDTTVNNLVSEWRVVEERLTCLKNIYSQADTSWARINVLKNEIEDWIRTVCPHVELGKPSSNIISMLKEKFPLYETKLEELQGLAGELCLTLSSSKKPSPSSQEESDNETVGEEKSQLPLNLELEIISRKLTFLKTYLSSLQAILEGSPERIQLLEEAKLTLSSASQVNIEAFHLRQSLLYVLC
jgi:hypothetical protein